MYHYLFKHKQLSITFFTLAPLAALIAVGLSFVLQLITDTATSRDINAFYWVIGITLIYILIDTSVDFLMRITRSKLLQTISRDLRQDIVEGTGKESIKAFKKKGSGHYLSMLENDIQIAESSFYQNICYLYYEAFSFIFAIIATTVIQPVVTLFIILLSLLPVLLPLLTKRLLERKKEAVTAELSVYTNKVKDFLGGFEIFKNFNIHSILTRQHAKWNDTLKNEKLADEYARKSVGALSYGLNSLLYLGTWLIGVYFVIQGSMSFGALIALTQLMVFISSPLMTASDVLTELIGAKAITKQIILFSTYEKENSIKKIPGNISGINYKNLSYSIGKKQIFRDVQLEINKGKKYAIIGESGSGKSTLFKLLFGYDEDYKGSIFIGDVERKEIDESYFYKNFGLLGQEVYLFNDSVRNNITLYQPFSDEKILFAMNQSGLNKWLEKNDYNLDYQVGELGDTLSGGERQRIALARVLLRNKPFLFFDEVTTGIDEKVAKEIEQTILSLENKTCVIITHHYNKDTLTKYDYVVSIGDEVKIDNIKS